MFIYPLIWQIMTIFPQVVISTVYAPIAKRPLPLLLPMDVAVAKMSTL